MHRITTPHVEIDSGFSAPQIRDFAVPFDVTGFFVFVRGSFNKATAYAFGVVSGKGSAFRGSR